ncbi:hypothetical protein XELAEV_180161963mg, partial [Xenopus laevis]
IFPIYTFKRLTREMGQEQALITSATEEGEREKTPGESQFRLTSCPYAHKICQ